MDDSDQDFVDLCSKLLKRVRKKPNDTRQAKKAEQQHHSQPSDGDKSRRTNKRNGDQGSKCAASQPVCNGAAAADPPVVCSGQDSGDAGSTVVPEAAAAKPGAEKSLTPKDKVLLRMQRFKRADPPRIVHKDQTTTHKGVSDQPVTPAQSQDAPETFSAGLHPVPQDSDEALALRLQQELDNEAAEARTVDLEEGGLYFCQICQRDLSHMSPEGRSQHLNRCLDESEQSAQTLPPPPLLPPPPPGVPDCPICGKKFKSQKSRSTHLKRCSTDLGVPPALLMQAVQRQAEETQNAPTANTLSQTGGTKRKGQFKPSLPAKKKPRKKAQPLDEDTMMAIALSSSMLEQEKEQQRERELITETAPSHASVASGLKWRPDAAVGKGRGKKKKGVTPHPPSLLLIQDTTTALAKLQERVSALLLRPRPPTPPTPTFCPSTLPGWSGAAPLWQKSALLDEGSTCLSDFYTPELKEFITPWEPVKTDAASSSTAKKPESSVRSEGTPLSASRASILLSQKASPSPAPSTPGTGQLPVGSQALRDLMELAEDGMTLTQCGYTASGSHKAHSASQTTNLHLSGFVLEESEEQANLCESGFLPEATNTLSKNIHSRARQTTDRSGADKEQSVALSRLALDLSSMVNNPQLSDVQLQVDSGDVFFAHSFMVYARCPLLAEMVHESGFGVQEEGMPAAQRVLINDVPGQAVMVLLRYFYTANCSIPASVRPHVMELASRFDLQELRQLCELHRYDGATQDDEDVDMNQGENVKEQTDQTLVELLRSMWNEEDDEDVDGADTDGEGEEKRGLQEHQTSDLTAADVEIHEEKVNEDELEEIYEFAATQRKRVEEDSVEEEEEEEKVDEEEEEEKVLTKFLGRRRSSEDDSIKNLQQYSQLKQDPSLDRSYSRLFSDSWGVYEEAEPSPLPSTSCAAKTSTSGLQQHQTPCKSTPSMSGRTLLHFSQENSLSPPPRSTNLPVPGRSPGLVGSLVTDKAEVFTVSPSLKQESQGPKSICVPLSPQLSPKKKEPELIVLSDSSEELEELPSSHSLSPCSPPEIQEQQSSHTQIKPLLVSKANEPSPEKKKPRGLDPSPRDSSSAHCSGDCSPEVSWLIPSTPVQRDRSSTSSSTQTRSSMCRTRLFPRRDASSSFVFSSPALHTSNRLKTPDSSSRVSGLGSPPEGSNAKIKQETEHFSSDLDLEFGPESTSDCDVNTGREVVSRSQTKGSCSSVSTSSKQDQSPKAHLPPYSSTPLHTELHLPSHYSPASLLRKNHDILKPASQKSESSPSESLEKTELGSFHLSPMSEPTDPPSSSSSCKDPQSSHNQKELSRQSRRSDESSRSGSSKLELTSREIGNEEGGDMGIRNKDTSDEGEKQGTESKEADFSFQQSFMDEPPIAFNDSWGLDPCVESNPGCFSLRLEDSRGSDLSPGRREAAKSSSSTVHQPSPAGLSVQSSKGCSGAGEFSPLKPYLPEPSQPQIKGLLDSKIWDSWNEGEDDEEEEKEAEAEKEEALPLSQRLYPPALHKTPAAPTHKKRRRTLVPITPMPHYSDMDTPDLKNKLNRFGVRPLPKRQMILKLKEIHQYTHQLVSSDSDSESPAQVKPPPSSSASTSSRKAIQAQPVRFKEPRVPANTSPLKHNRGGEAELLSNSQGSNTSSTAEESERSNPELCVSSDGDSDSDGGISSSQVASRLQDRLQAVRAFILSDSALYDQILQYQPLVLSHLQERLKAAGIRLGAAKLVDYLDSQCITFTTAKPGHPAPSRRRGRKPKAAGDGGVGRKKVATALL